MAFFSCSIFFSLLESKMARFDCTVRVLSCIKKRFDKHQRGGSFLRKKFQEHLNNCSDGVNIIPCRPRHMGGPIDRPFAGQGEEWVLCPLGEGSQFDSYKPHISYTKL
jgi:hypothetical protein